MDSVTPHAQEGNPLEKRCSKCNNVFPATPEFFHRNGTGLRPNCKACNRKRVNDYYKQPDVHAQRIDYTKEYRERNQEHIRAHKKAYYSQPEIQEHKREYTRTYRTRPDVKEKRRIESSEYNSKPEVKARRLDNERRYLQIPEKRKHKRERDRVNQHTRRSRKRIVKGTHTPEQIQDLLKRQKRKCYYCSVRFEKKDGKYVYHIDHTFPLSRVAGTDIPANDINYLVLACPKCNTSKNDKFPWEWSEGGRLL